MKTLWKVGKYPKSFADPTPGVRLGPGPVDRVEQRTVATNIVSRSPYPFFVETDINRLAIKPRGPTI